MVMWWVMFCEIIPHVLASWFPINKKRLFFNPILHPIKLHVHCLGNFLSNCSGDDTLGRVVVYSYWYWRLGKTEFVECNYWGYQCLPIVEQSSDFLFGRGRHHMLEDSAFREYWAIFWWREVWRFFRSVGSELG